MQGRVDLLLDGGSPRFAKMRVSPAGYAQSAAHPSFADVDTREIVVPERIDHIVLHGLGDGNA